MVEENTTQTTEEQTTDQQTTQDTQNQDTTTEQTEDEGTLLGGKEGEEGEQTKVEVPEKYEFKLPEGMEGIELDAKAVETFTPVFKEIGLSQEQAQKLVNAYAPYIKQQVETQKNEALDSWTKQVDDWKTETTKLLGSESKEQLSIAGKFIEKFGTPQLRQVLNETGLGNHPELVKAFIKAGKAISEDTFVEPDKTTQTTGGVNLGKLYDHPSSKK